MALLRSHGITRDPKLMGKASDGPWYYKQVDLGFNYRMSDVHAVLGVSQMNRLDEYVTRRHEIANRYDKLLAGLPLRSQVRAEYSALHLYVIRLNNLGRLAIAQGCFLLLCASAASVSIYITFLCTHSPTTWRWVLRKEISLRLKAITVRRSACPCILASPKRTCLKVAGSLTKVIKG